MKLQKIVLLIVALLLLTTVAFCSCKSDSQPEITEKPEDITTAQKNEAKPVSNKKLPVYTVTFYKEDGTFYRKAEVEANQTVEEVAPPSPPNYCEFIGWYYGDELFDFSTPIKYHTGLYAKYNHLKYKITVKYNNGDPDTILWVEKGEDYSIPEPDHNFLYEHDINATSGKIQTVDHYLCKTWPQQEIYEFPSSGVFNLDYDVVLEAQWKNADIPNEEWSYYNNRLAKYYSFGEDVTASLDINNLTIKLFGKTYKGKLARISSEPMYDVYVPIYWMAPIDDNYPQIITFGKYEQDNNPTNGAEALQWICLGIKDGKALLTTYYGIDMLPFEESEVNVDHGHSGKYNDTSWESSSIRKHLNNEFLKNFTSEEKKLIIGYESEPGITDKVFLLSAEEYQQWMPEVLRNPDLTSYAFNKQSVQSDYYVLYSALESYYDLDYHYYMFRPEGTVSGGHLDDGFVDDLECIRPCIWVALDEEP